MIKNYTCIICPLGCEIKAIIEESKIVKIDGHTCLKGKDYVEQENMNPQRSIATSIYVEGGDLPLVSVRLTKPIPKNRIFDVMNELKKVKLTAPVNINQVVIKNVLNLNTDVITTKKVGC